MKSAIAVSNGAAQETMTSLELARVTGVRHDSMKRGIERLAKGGKITLPPLCEVSNEGSGPKKISVFLLNKHESVMAAATIDPAIIYRIIDRWQQLEDERAASSRHAVTVPDFSDPAAMAEAWAVQYRAAQAAEREVLQLEHKTARDAPLVAFAEAVTESDGEIDIATMAKLLGTGSKRLFDFLREKRVLFKDGRGDNVPFQQHIDCGRFRVVEKDYHVRVGIVVTSQKTVVTGKGQLFVAKLWIAEHGTPHQIPLPC